MVDDLWCLCFFREKIMLHRVKGLGLWCLMPLWTIFHLYRRGNRSTRRNYWPDASHWQSKSCIEYTFPWTGFKCTTLVVLGNDCTSSCKSNNYTIMTTTALPCEIRMKEVIIVELIMKMWNRWWREKNAHGVWSFKQKMSFFAKSRYITQELQMSKVLSHFIHLQLDQKFQANQIYV